MAAKSLMRIGTASDAERASERLRYAELSPVLNKQSR
jgi:hypothetical protein